MSARYIDADFVSGRLREVLHGPKSEFPDDFEQAINCLVYAISILEFAPTADVVPVIHAHWTGVTPMVDTIMCSNCGWNYPTDEFATPYCPSCGARMDEEM